MVDLGLTALGWATIAAALGAVVAAAVAILQVRQGRVHFRRQATFAHLRRISDQVGKWVRWPNVQAIQREILDYYRHQSDPDEDLAEHGSDYLALLTELDLLAFASERNLADAKIVREYTQTIYHDDLVSRSFLHEYQQACGSELPYRFLLRRLEALAWAEQYPVVSKFPLPRSIAMRLMAQNESDPETPQPREPPRERPRETPVPNRRGDEQPVRENFPPPRSPAPGEGGGGGETDTGGGGD